MEDLVISRRCFYKRTAVPANTNVRLRANPNRLGVRLSAVLSGSANFVISPTDDDATNLTGYVAGYVNPAAVGDVIGVIDVHIDYRKDGPAVRDDVYVRIVSQAGFVVETIMDPDLAAEVNRKVEAARPGPPINQAG